MVETGVDRRSILFAAVGAAMVLAGCEPQRGRKPGQIIIGSSPSGVPFSFVDPWTNKLTGSMIDTADAITAALHLAPDFQITPFAALIPSLTAFKIDMIAAAMLRTPEREKIVAFSDPVYSYSGGLIVHNNDRGSYPDLSALHDRRVGAQLGTRFIDQLAAAGIEQVSTYDNLGDLLRDLGHGRIDAAYGDAPILAYQLRVGPRRAVRMVADFHAPAKEELCLVLRRGDPLLPSLNAVIANLRQRRIQSIIKHWGLD